MLSNCRAQPVEQPIAVDGVILARLALGKFHPGRLWLAVDLDAEQFAAGYLDGPLPRPADGRAARGLS